MRVAYVTNLGMIRKNNEDAYICDPVKQLFVVADGMGGCVAGEIASALAVETLEQTIGAEETDSPGETLREAFYQANDRIYQQAQQDTKYAGMGTTLTGIWIVQDRGYLSHVGDSRAYLIRNKQIIPLTDDHSLVGELLREGGLTEAEAMVHPQKNILTRALGSNQVVEIDYREIEILPGDHFFLCTDGMSNLVSSDEILKEIMHGGSLNDITDKLLKLALQRGGNDNITAVLVENR